MPLEISTETTLRDWISHGPMAVLFNAGVTPRPAREHVPTAFKTAIGERRLDILAATAEELDDLGIVLSHEDQRRFARGEPTLIAITAVAHRQQLRQGRRRKDELERSVQDGLSVATYVAVERLVEWTRMRDGRHNERTVSARRERVLTMLAGRTAPEMGSEDARAEDATSIAFWKTLHDAGGRLVSTWHADVDRPGQLAERARRIVAGSASMLDRDEIQATIGDEIDRLLFLVICLKRARLVALAAHGMSASIAAKGRMTKGQQAMLAGTRIENRPNLYDAVRAAFDGDFDVSMLFPALIIHRPMIDLARRLGRAGRGQRVEIDVEAAATLRRSFVIHHECATEIARGSGKMTLEQGAGFWLAKAALELSAMARWQAAIDDAIRTEGVIGLCARAAETN